MSGDNANLSFKERLSNYKNRHDEIQSTYESKMANLKEEVTKDVLANIPVKINDVFKRENFGSKDEYFKVTEIKVSVDGTITVYGTKQKLDGEWSKRNNIFMFCAGPANNYQCTNLADFKKVYNHV